MEIACPECGARESYLLADGRRQCRECRKKFTPGGRKRKLAEEVQARVREAFWEMQPAETVASANNLNRKTVQRMYAEFRQMLAQYNTNLRIREQPEVSTQGQARRFVVGNGKHFPIFYLADFGECIAMYRADEFAHYEKALRESNIPVLMVYRKSDKGLRLDPDELFRTMLWGEGDGSGCRECLDYMLRLMKTYRGVHGEKADLYVEEMIFRFNCRDRSVALGLLKDSAVAGCNNIMH